MVYGVGVYEPGEYKSYINGKQSKEYSVWAGMLKRCYGERKKYNRAYDGCSVCDEWHNFQNFAKWYNKNKYNFKNDELVLDKDLLKKNNKIYSPYTCCLLPKRLNKLIMRGTINRGEYPIGVRDCNGSIVAEMKIIEDDGYRHTKYIGSFKTKEEAFDSYKKEKEKYIKHVAEQYKDIIPDYIYKALNNYKILITD